MTVRPGTVTAAALEMGIPVTDITTLLPTPPRTRRKVPRISEKTCRHQWVTSWKSRTHSGVPW